MSLKGHVCPPLPLADVIQQCVVAKDDRVTSILYILLSSDCGSTWVWCNTKRWGATRC